MFSSLYLLLRSSLKTKEIYWINVAITSRGSNCIHVYQWDVTTHQGNNLKAGLVKPLSSLGYGLVIAFHTKYEYYYASEAKL